MKGGHPEGPGQAEAVGPWKTHEFQEDQVQSAAPGLGQTLVSTQARG